MVLFALLPSRRLAEGCKFGRSHYYLTLLCRRLAEGCKQNTSYYTVHLYIVLDSLMSLHDDSTWLEHTCSTCNKKALSLE